jgi:O-antigen ligase
MAHPANAYMRLWQLGIPAFAAAVGLLAGLSPQLGLAAALAAAFVALVLSDLALGIVLFVVVAFLEGVAGLGSLSLPKAAGMLLVGSWLLTRLRDDEDRRELTRDHPALVAGLVALAAWVTLSAVWAEQTGTALGAALRWGPNLALIAIAYAAIRRPQHVRWLFAGFVAGALLSAIAGVALGGAGEGSRDRLVGAGLNANELGALLAIAVILAGALGACRDLSPAARGLALSGGVAAIAALMLTASRGALLGLGASLLLAPILVGPGRRLMAVLLAVVVVGCTVGYATYLAPDIVARITEEDSTGSGRTDIWKVGWRIVEDKPIVGVGADNFANSTVHYLLEPGAIPNSDYIVDTPKVAHNIYLQVLAELGAVGLILFLFVLAVPLVVAMRAARTFAHLGDRSMDLLTRALVIALAGWLASAFFSSAIYSKQFWMLLAVCVAVAGLSRAALSQARESPSG